MRWIFLLLLTANIAYVAWELNQPETHRHVVADDPNVPKLVLLSELPHAAPTPPEMDRAPAKTVLAQEVKAPVAGVEHSQETEKPPEKKSENKAAAPTKPVAVETVKTPLHVPPEQKKPAQVTFACYTLGPFRDIADLRKLTRDIHNHVVESSFRSHKEREQSMYWVYLPRQKSHEAANALGARLKRKNIRDYYVVPKGDQANAISLGHFKEKKGALSLQKKVKAAGFPAQIEPIFKTYTLYWLDYRVKTNRTIPRSALDLSSMPNVSRFDRSCK